MRAGSLFSLSSSTYTTSEGSSSEMERSLPVCLASLAGLFSGDVSEGFLVSFRVSDSEVWVFALFEVDVATKGWLEESSEVSVVGLLGLAVAEEMLVPGSMKRGAGDLGLADFIDGGRGGFVGLGVTFFGTGRLIGLVATTGGFSIPCHIEDLSSQRL